MEAAYIIHCIDEAVVGGGFVEMVKRHFWPEYSARKFFWFNVLLHIINVSTIIAYETMGDAWVIAPLSMPWLFTTNGLWHVLEAVKFREYSPGLATSQLYWIIMYHIIRYGLLTGQIPTTTYITAAIIGTTTTTIMIGSLFAIRRIKGGKTSN
jgi:hypothetical protein